MAEAVTNEPAAQALIAAERASLLAKGLPPKFVDGAIRRADNKARSMASRVPQEPDAYRILLATELTTCEKWVRSMVERLAE